MKLRLVDDWKDAWKWLSVNCMVLAASVQGAWHYIPDDLRDKAPDWLGAGATVALLALGVTGRLLQQGKPKALPPKKPTKKRKR